MNIEKNVQLKNFITFRTGGPADFFCRVKNIDDVKMVQIFVKEHSTPVFFLGGGSNLLVSEKGFRGLVVKSEIEGFKIIDETEEKVRVEVGSGVGWDTFVQETVNRGWGGLENLSFIPGTVGAAPVQNIGAYGVEAGQFIDSVTVYDFETGNSRTFGRGDCQFGYRDSFFKKKENKNLFIVSVAFSLSKKSVPNISYKDLNEYFKNYPQTDITPLSVRNAVIEIRQKKLPDWRVVGTAGSFFKNPVVKNEVFEKLRKDFENTPGFLLPDGTVKVPLAWILDNVLHLKGYRENNVATHEGQPLVLVNYKDATGEEVAVFAQKIITQVKDKVGISIEPEVEYVGF